MNWLLLPGGPGLGSESLLELADALDVPDSVWLVDLPGDGSNIERADGDSFAQWPQLLVEAAQAFSDAIFVGHSTGGICLLAAAQPRVASFVAWRCPIRRLTAPGTHSLWR